jgi:membrane fusion protein, multidrug efflux system
MNHKWFYLIVCIAFIVCSCQIENRKNETTSGSIPVVITQAKKIVVNNKIAISGNIEGNRTVRLGFMVAGKINYIGKDEGRWFAKDQLIASLDPSSYEIAKEMADVQVAQVEDEYNRLKAMFNQHSISESDFAKVNFGLQQAKTQQKLHAKNLADTKLYAPFSGVLLKKLGEVGEITGIGIPQFVFSDISKVKVSAFIPENELHLIKLGLEASVSVSALNETFTGKIVELGSFSDPASRSFNMKIELDNPKMLILPGMIAEVTIPSADTIQVLTVPVETILHDINNQSFLYIADKELGKAFKRIVTIGKLYNDNIEITSGISENEPIISGGQQKLVDGASITIQKL